MTALDQFKAAVSTDVGRFAAMDQRDMVAALIALIKDSGVEHGDHEQLGDLLVKVAELGSLQAVAALIAIGADEGKIYTAIRLVTQRSPDIVEAMAVETLERELEVFCDEEVRAGRMTKRKDPETGRWLYSFVEGKRS